MGHPLVDLFFLLFRWWEGVEAAREARVEVGLPQAKQVLAVGYLLLPWHLRTTLILVQDKAMVSCRSSCLERNFTAYTNFFE